MKSIVATAGNYLTTRQAAKLLNISVRTAQQWVDAGKLEGWTTQGGHRRISHDSVMNAMGDRKILDSHEYKLSILIVEDDIQIIKLYRTHINMWPFAVRAVFTPNGYEALVLAGEANPNLLICDLRLPGINGFQIVRALACMDRFSKLKIVVVSGLPINEIKAHGGLPSGVEIIGKPIDFNRLREIAQEQWDLGNSA